MTGLPVFGDLRVRNRSVDEISAYGDGTMNVWQTLEVISGNNLRKKYHYDGYNDVENVLRTFTTSSHRRDSYVDKVNSPDDSNGNDYGASGERGKSTKTDQVNSVGTHGTKNINPEGGGRKKRGGRGKFVKTKKKISKLPPLPGIPAEEGEMVVLSLDCTDLVKCSFNLPRISAKLERLMGTNVVRLTDRKYMRELRQRIDEDYRMQLSNRIKNREIKELERERNLILDGKTDAIPEELSADPIFVVNKRANIEIVKRRAKLKTNREKNAERLLRQGLKWERERLRHEEQQRQKQMKMERIKKEQKELEKRYQAEDAQRGLDLLRINDTEWQECEQNLREFLENERSKMKERSLRISKQFTTDPLDIQNIVRARRKFRETEKRIRLQLERSQSDKSQHSLGSNAAMLVSAVDTLVSSLQKLSPEEEESHVSVYLGDDDASEIPSSTEASLQTLTSTPNIKEEKQQEMESQMDSDVKKGHLVTSSQYANLRYDDLQIAKLREATNIRELYKIAEKIIIGEVEELMGTEEVEIEEEDNDD
ncbi:trichohyalin isoform X2 [Eupeodes corollae]|uniref:trichohyalin isoform X2 n=1 Tax=Eupeodes corollae TaxID=290404 RepID=UPI0024938A27|nr:trichohyalin isoform X2 [Eupeodes corollae]